MKKEADLQNAAEGDAKSHRFANMSYINYLNRRQRMIERGVLNDEEFVEEEEDGQSEEDSMLSHEEESPTKGAQSKEAAAAEAALKLAQA